MEVLVLFFLKNCSARRLNWLFDLFFGNPFLSDPRPLLYRLCPATIRIANAVNKRICGVTMPLNFMKMLVEEATAASETAEK